MSRSSKNTSMINKRKATPRSMPSPVCFRHTDLSTSRICHCQVNKLLLASYENKTETYTNTVFLNLHNLKDTEMSTSRIPQPAYDNISLFPTRCEGWETLHYSVVYDPYTYYLTRLLSDGQFRQSQLLSVLSNDGTAHGMRPSCDLQLLASFPLSEASREVHKLQSRDRGMLRSCNCEPGLAEHVRDGRFPFNDPQCSCGGGAWF